MKKRITKIAFFVLCLGVIGVYVCNTYIEKNRAHINKIFNFASRTRQAPVDEIENILIDYSVGNDIKKTIINFLHKTIDQTFDQSRIQQAKGAPYQGLSGNPVFFVRDVNENLKFVTKVFENPFGLDEHGTFLQELSGFQLASTIHGKSFNFPFVLAVGKCDINNQQYGLLAISAAPGRSIADLLIKVSLTKPDTSQRSDALRVAQRALKKLGNAFKELHQIRAKKRRGIHPAIIKTAKTYFSGAKNRFEKTHEIDIQVLEKYFYMLLDWMKNIEITYSFVHGDTNLGNFIYDAKTDSLTLIDLPFFSGSADQNGNPISNAGFDFVGITEMIGSFIKNEEENTKFKNAFIDAYGDIVKDKGYDFFTLLYRLRSIMWASGFLEWKKDQPEEVMRGFKDWLQFSIDELKKILSKFEEISE